ncbi:glycoside hydrolase family 68 protein [Bacillus mangrovi]|uniref:Glycoside hydrolase family 68 protein n=1 Tax=Metabacillus mangrovi TaxID=1491830 RepID=A0A7X2V5Z1_9BACI|nr:glycoside hydrolase family 68 protein [Metabacillus mangrovi]MTH55317.1 glycoside hydrolase family 68 protein [Metabacillus mangrovi]
MNIQNILKRTTVLTLTSALLLGGGTQAFAQEYKNHKKKYGQGEITRYDISQIPGQLAEDKERFTVPAFDASKLKNIESATGFDKDGNKILLDVWDTWPLMNADGTVADYKGYDLVFGLAGDPADANDTSIYLFYKKKGDNSMEAWKNAGKVFENDVVNPNDPHLPYKDQDWSGSAVMTEEGDVRLFYTNRSDRQMGKQTLTTAQVNLSQPSSTELKLAGVSDHKSIFAGDGQQYQTIQQFIDQGGFQTGDNHTLRDPHYIEDKGKKYLVFEANTGTKTGYQGEKSLFNRAYYGGKNSYFKAEKERLLNSDKKQAAELANGAMGIIEINDDFTFKKVMKPLLTSNTVTDEIERPNIFKHDGKWYLFTDTRGAKMTIDGVDNEDIFMLGYVANSLSGKFKPLNETGLVLHHDLDPNDKTFNYAHYAVPQKSGDDFVVTSYITNRGFFEDQKSSFAPSFLLNIDGDETTVVKDSILEQGQLEVSKNKQGYGYFNKR